MRVLVLAAHPKYSGSVVHRAMRASLAGLAGVTLHDLYAAYPDFAVDVGREQQRLLDHDLIVLQHPFYWYSAPAIIKEWLDLVLENGWAYGPGGTKLAGKYMMSAISTGGSAAAYQPAGRNRFTIDTLLAPFNQSAHLCGMAWLRPFVIHAGRRLTEETLSQSCAAYRDLLATLASGRLNPLDLLAESFTLPESFTGRTGR